MKRLEMRTLVFLVFTVLIIVAVFPSVRSDAQTPPLSEGDMWKYNIQASLDLGNGTNLGTMTGTLSETVDGRDTVLSNGTAYDTYRISISGSGSIVFSGGYFSGRTIPFTASGAITEGVSDLAILMGSFNLSLQIYPGFSYTFTSDITSMPPLKSLDFPLSVGNSWITVSNVAYHFQGFGIGEISNTTRIIQRYVVDRTERVTVPAGSFQTYVIKPMDAEATETFYAPQAANVVKGKLFFGLGPANIELVEYNAAPYKSLLNVSRHGRNFVVEVGTNVEATNLRHNSTAISFNVAGQGSGKGTVWIPNQLNESRIRVYVNSSLVQSTISGNSTHYRVDFGFTTSQHTIAVFYAQSSGSVFDQLFGTPYLLPSIVITAVGVASAAIVVATTRRRSPPALLPPKQNS